MSIKGTLSFYVSKSHSDYSIVKNQANEARRLYNTINKLKQEKSELNKNSNYQTSVANSLNIDLSQPYSEKWRKQIETAQNIQLPQKVAQHVSKQCDQTWKSIISLRTKGQKSNNPKYKKQYCEIRFTKQAISQNKTAKKENKLIPSGWSTGFLLPDNVNLEQVESLLIIPRPDGFEIKALYKKNIIEKPLNKKPKMLAGGDLGLDKLITIITTEGSRPKTVNGKGLKSINRYFNKEIGQLKSKRDKAKGGEKEKFNKEIQRLWFKRDRQIKHFLNSASNEIVRYLSGIGVQHFVIGWSDGFKNEINLGKKNNQNFVSVPHALFRDLLVRKCVEAGIGVEVQEESYTSKASFLDGDVVPVFRRGVFERGLFSGMRVSRGEYRSGSGKMIHADVNAAWNILRKKCKLSIGQYSRVVAYPENLKIKF